MRRLIIKPEALKGGRIHISDNDDISYLSYVLRMKEGDGLLVSDGAGWAWNTQIEKITKNEIELAVLSERMMPCDDATTRVTLYQGLPKGAKMDELVRKATELGVFRVVPVETARTIPKRNDVSSSKLERWRRIAREASKQSRRIRVPAVNEATGFEEAAAGLAEEAYDLILVLFELEEGHTLKHALREWRKSQREGSLAPEIAVFTGPEGGFESGEVERLVHEGAQSVTIGETILRTETAGPAAVAMILYELDL